MRWLKVTVALAAAIVVGCGSGIACGSAGRVVYVTALYDVACALALSVALVAVLHLLRWPRHFAVLPLAVVAVLCAQASRHVVDAWALHSEQVRWLTENPDATFEGTTVSGAADARSLVDLGLQADTGQTGLRGAWLAQAKAGWVVWRSGALQRVVPMPLWLQGLLWAVSTAWLTLVVWRALRHLQAEPRCAICGRFARRTEAGRLDAAAAADVATAWGRGERPPLPIAEGPAVAVVYTDSCPVGHSTVAGLSMVSVRRRGWSARIPGPWATLPARDELPSKPD